MKQFLFSIAAIGLLGSTAALANCPTITTGDSAKYLAVYAQSTTNVGSSWRLMIRPRNGACFSGGNGFQSPVQTTGLKDGPQKSASIKDGAHNCNDDYKSYISIDIPSYADVKSVADATKGGTNVGWKVCMTKGGDCYRGIAVVAPSKATPDAVDVKGICFK